MVGIFHLCLGQGSFAAHAPVDRLYAFIDITAFNEFSERAYDACDIPGLKRKVRVVPVAENAEALELLLLRPDEL